MCSLVTWPYRAATSRMTNLSEGRARCRLWHSACISRGSRGGKVRSPQVPAGERGHAHTTGHVDPAGSRGWRQSPISPVPSEGDRVPVTVCAGEGASPVPGSAHPSPGEAFAEPLGPPPVLSPLNPAEQMAPSHLQSRLASRRTRLVLNCGHREQNRGGLQCFCRAAARGHPHVPARPRSCLRSAPGRGFTSGHRCPPSCPREAVRLGELPAPSGSPVKPLHFHRSRLAQ